MTIRVKRASTRAKFEARWVNAITCLLLSALAAFARASYGSGGATGMGNIRDPLQEIVLLPGRSYLRDVFGGSEVTINGLPSNSENIRIDGCNIF
jgi:hypothetical protein